MKKCIKCNEIKDLTNFRKTSANPNKLMGTCIMCAREYAREYRKKYYQQNKQEIIEYSNNYLANTENGRKIRNKSMRKYQKNRYKTDILFKLRKNLSSRLRFCLKVKYTKKDNSFLQYLGCSLNELKFHIEKQFQPGMSWDNHGEWHIDHIIPLSSGTIKEEIYKLTHYTNLQPLWAADNLKKSDKY